MHSTFALLVLLAACGDDDDSATDMDTDSAADTDTDTDTASDSDSGTDTDTMTVDASAADVWVYVDLGTMAVVTPAAPTNSTAWDVAFQRFNIAVNGGVSGTGGVEVATVEAASLDAVTEIPATGFVTDTDANGDSVPEYALGGWYDYDPATHVLSCKDVVYVVRSAEGDHFAFEMLDYYDDGGNAGHPRFAVALLAAP